MWDDLVLKPLCDRCGSKFDLYGTDCKHLTLCVTCGKAMAKNRAECNFCFVVVSRLIREYNVRASTSTDKALYIGRFMTGLPPFSKKKSSENKWTLHKQGIQGQPLFDSHWDKNKNITLVLEDETGQHQYQGQQIDGAQAATYYLLMMHGKELVAVPAHSWHNFNKIAQYKQLTLEEAEEKMSRRRNNAIGYERWMMKAATNGPAAFGEMKRDEVLDNDASGNNHPEKGKSNSDEAHSSKGEEDVKQEEAMKNRPVPNKKSIDNADEDEGTIKGVYDLDDDDMEKGDDWEHEQTFTDDDEAVGNNPEEREDLAPELPAPPEIKQDEGDEEGGLSKSGKELKKLLGRVAGLKESDSDEDEDDMDDDNCMSPVPAPKQNAAFKDDPAENSLSKSLSSASAQETPTTKSSKAKRKLGSDHVKSHNAAPAKKMKTGYESRLACIKDEPPTTTKSNVSPKASTSVLSRTGPSPSVVPFTLDEMRAFLVLWVH